MTKLEEIARAMQAESANKPFSWKNAARAAVEAMREPPDAAVQTACASHTPRQDMSEDDPRECPRHRNARFRWQAMIDTILSETSDEA
jgi:hypothetical protein